MAAGAGVVDDGTDESVEARLGRFFDSATGGAALGPDDDYFALGLVNSLLALEIVAYVERVFQVRVEVEDLDLDNFRTIARIAAFVRGKWGSGGAGRPA
ncbi:acyl carrier protein [Actinokineospora sp. NBRC 105648]|uniref:acyl carrier protein n=1 Tax=Actinokineospora sp. NBRC 105648 TaxID=3032206 RepID=UPI0024A31B61|nr:acyl carrier protein [Actinokineospora sp. NBRC 105648]GLZ40300.1 hypothetical protein Acsp05_39240 [Actinokineospora sp. NBRC 105648]